MRPGRDSTEPHRLRLLGAVTIAAALLSALTVLTAQEARFKVGTERVTVAVVVRDSGGRPVTGLPIKDFEVRDQGQLRSITDFRHDAGPISLALLLDSSGSMQVGPKVQRMKEVAHLLLAAMKEGTDEAALFGFDQTVHVMHPFTDRFARLQAAVSSAAPFGSTSLYDAIAHTADQLTLRPGRHAIVVLTDGIDTSSRLTAPEVSGIASAIDVPVYVVVVGLPIDLSEDRAGENNGLWGNLEDLARWTGGMLYKAANPADASIAARDLVTILRYQYVLAFEPGTQPGWHRLDVRVRQRETIQARSGYWVGPSSFQR